MILRMQAARDYSLSAAPVGGVPGRNIQRGVQAVSHIRPTQDVLRPVMKCALEGKQHMQAMRSTW